MNGVKIGSDTISGQKVDIEADARSQRFYITLKGDILGRGETLERAKRDAAVTIRKRRVKVAVPFALADGRRGVADGIHQKNRSVLSSIDGKREDLGYNPKALRPDIPDETLKRIGDIDEETRTLQRERGAIVREYELDLVREVNGAILDTIKDEDEDKEGATDAS